MNVARWDELEVLFERIEATPEPERQALLDEVRRSDMDLHAELVSLLAFQTKAHDFFESLANAVLPSALLDVKRRDEPDPYGLVGRTVSHYRVLEPIGGGGMGFVYKAEDPVLRRMAALKFLPPGWVLDAGAKVRFLHEAQAASALDHPNVCAVYEVGETGDGQLFIAMGYYPGETLQEKIARGPLPVDEALDYAIQIAEGLGAAHARGIVHRDVKPANVIVTPEGTVKLIDFGLAKLADRTQITKAGVAIGTVAYMSPEQVRGDVVDHRADFWAVGVVLYEMLTGQRPFRGEYEQAVVYAILNSDPVPLNEVRPDAPAALSQFVSRCLGKDPLTRFNHAAALLNSLRQGRPRGGSVWNSRAWRRQWAALPRAGRFASIASFALVLSIVGLFVPEWDLFAFRGNPPTSASALHVAVLPFMQTGTDEDEAFAEGLALTLPEILEHVGRVAEAPITVAPVSQSLRMASTGEAARKLGAVWVVQGRVLDEGDQMRLVLDFVNTRDRHASTTETIVVARTDRASLQADVAEAIAEAFNINLSADALYALSVLATRDSEAYRFYLEGRARLQGVNTHENLDAAIQSFRWAVDEDSLFALAHAGLCSAFWAKYKTAHDTSFVAHAEESCSQADRLNQRLPSVYETIGAMYIETGVYEQAIREFQAALVLDSLRASAYRGLAIAYEKLGKTGEAEHTYKRAIELMPTGWSNYNDLGVLYLAEGRYSDAAIQFQQVIKHDPNNLWGFNNLGTAYLYIDDRQKAREMFVRANEIQSSDFAYANLGVVSYLDGNYVEEASMYEKALSIDSSDFRVWGNLAGAYSRIPGRGDEAHRTFEYAAELAEKQLTINPDNANILHLLAGYYINLDEPSRSKVYIERALAIASQDVDIMVQAGAVYEALGEREEALEWIHRALDHGYVRRWIEEDPDFAELCKDPRF